MEPTNTPVGTLRAVSTILFRDEHGVLYTRTFQGLERTSEVSRYARLTLALALKERLAKKYRRAA